jgi:two-component system OmpR family sensor kinase
VAVNRLTAGIDRATRLVEQLLALAREQASVAAGARPETLQLGDVARLAVSDQASDAQQQGIDMGLRQVDETRITGHAEALRILLRNLLDNAVKHTPAGGSVDVEVIRRDGATVLAVDDSGPGIPEADRVRVLDRFHRVAGTPTTGSGLGLAIVKSIADLHGARVELLASARLGGLRVEVVFPPQH